MEKKYTLVYGIRGKLISAVCMLLVAVIMVVSSTYAWFTLSTAPEITGITTTVGANGALEMLLATKDGNNNWFYGDSIPLSSDWATKNTYWGNLVDVSDNSVYGINNLKLYPSDINYAEGDDTKLSTASFLKIPVYGPDGRISDLDAKTVTSTYNNGFYRNEGYGIRAIGVASGMTDRQYAYRNLLAAAQSNMSSAKNAASASLTSNGATLANVALKKATNDTPTFNKADVEAIQAIVDDLIATNGILEKIEDSYLNYIYAYAASSEVTGDADSAYTTIQNYFADEESVRGIDKLYAIVAPVEEGETRTQGKLTLTLGTGATFDITLPEALFAPLNALKATRDNVEKADAYLDTLATATATDGSTVGWDDGATHTWGEGEAATTETIGISDALYLLADTDAMELNGIPASQVKEKMNDLVNSAMGKGLTVSMTTGGGVYADVADHCGDYDTSVTIAEVSYGTLKLNNMTAAMKTKSTVTPSYLARIHTTVSNKAPASGTATAQPLTEFYGYVIDLAFRTNAANSNLLLEVNGADRIYDDQTGQNTQGGGSTMTFKRSEAATDLSDDQVKALMDATRIVFFDPTNANTILAYAQLDLTAGNVQSTADGFVANIRLVKEYDGVKTDAGVYYGLDKETGNILALGADGLPTTNVAYYCVTEGEVTKYYAKRIAATEEGGTDTYENEFTESFTAAHVTVLLDESYSEIVALTANNATHVSALVYLDGNKLGNDDVSAMSDTSVTMKMNLQFRSDANLVPMEDATLHTGGEAESESTTESESESQS